MKKNWLTTVGGLMTALGGVPLLVATSGYTPPSWWQHLVFPLILIGILGAVITGWAAKGADEHSDQSQVNTATVVKKVEQVQEAQQKTADWKPFENSNKEQK